MANVMKYAAVLLALARSFTLVLAVELRVCEHCDFTINCYLQYIDVEWALYGREEGSKICQKENVVPCGNETSSLQTVQEACQRKHICSFEVENEFFKGDPCVNVGKYLAVIYKCMPWEVRPTPRSTTKTPQSTTMTHQPSTKSSSGPGFTVSVLVVILGGVGGGIVLVILVVCIWKCCRCNKFDDHGGRSRTRNEQEASWPVEVASRRIEDSNRLDEVFNPTFEAPPSYAEALALDVNTESNVQVPPPVYYSAVPGDTPRATGVNEGET